MLFREHNAESGVHCLSRTKGRLAFPGLSATNSQALRRDPLIKKHSKGVFYRWSFLHAVSTQLHLTMLKVARRKDRPFRANRETKYASRINSRMAPPAFSRQRITVSLHCEKNFPARKARSDWDIPLPMGMADDDYLKVVDDTLNYLLPLYQPDLVLYDAGVDVHRDDALGYLHLTDEGVARRDEAVMRHCLGRDIPVMGVIGGGYSKDRKALARRHGILHHSAQRVWIERGL